MKKPPRSYGFQERLDFSNGHAPHADSVLPFLADRIPNFKTVRRALKQNDKDGTDYYIERYGLKTLAVDLKLRDTDYSVQAPDFSDDLALETFSVKEKDIIGWTRDGAKTADYILWYWKDTGRFFIVPFPPLCCVFQRCWEAWRERFGAWEQHTPGTRGWHSECVFVPRRLVMEAIWRWGSGHDTARIASEGKR
jgi:hypothetical protein